MCSLPRSRDEIALEGSGIVVYISPDSADCFSSTLRQPSSFSSLSSDIEAPSTMTQPQEKAIPPLEVEALDENNQKPTIAALSAGDLDVGASFIQNHDTSYTEDGKRKSIKPCRKMKLSPISQRRKRSSGKSIGISFLLLRGHVASSMLTRQAASRPPSKSIDWLT